MSVSPVPRAARPSAQRLSLNEVRQLYRQPLFALIEQAHAVHREWHPEAEVQLCQLLSVKTGGCPEDCAYCPQSARYDSGVTASGLMALEDVLAAARRARDAGATRFCMGAAWRQPRDGEEFDRVLEMVRGVADLGLEVCCTLGMLSASQAQRLAAAGLTAYNHNLDTSPEFYGSIISTRVYADRLRTLEHVRDAGISICCGGILGMGESEEDRIRLLHVLATLPRPPESVPLNALVAVDGTPLAGRAPLGAFEFVRAIAAARILMPPSKVRLSAGRLSLSPEAQALCFYAGANSIFVGEKLLTTPNPNFEEDRELLAALGLGIEPPRKAGHGATHQADENGSRAMDAASPGNGAAAPRRAAPPAAAEMPPLAALSLPGASSPPPAPSPTELQLGGELREWRALERYRTLRQPLGIDFCSNDYLGLASDASVRAAMTAALESGLQLGSTASRLVRGEHPVFSELERKFAAFRGAEAALFFGSGYAANVGLLTALLSRGDVVFSDALNHASLIDGMRLSGCERVIVPHLDLEALEAALRQHRPANKARRIVVVESIFSMEGDRAPLEEIAQLCSRHAAELIVDEAHATGIFGPVGEGCAVAAGIAQQTLATVHTCGKSFGAAGAFVCGSSVLRDYLVNRARPFIYSTAPPPLLAVQISAALEVALAEPWRRERVHELARRLRSLLGDLTQPSRYTEPASPIIPVQLGTDRAAVAVAAELARAGFDVRAIRPPTVPEGTARLRIVVHAFQTEEQLTSLSTVLFAAVAAVGGRPLAASS